jgi:Flp pilus assembly protein TadB
LIPNLNILFTLAAAGTLAYMVYFLLERLLAYTSGPGRALDAYARRSGAEDAGAAQAELGSRAYKICLAFSAYGLDVGGWEMPALYLAYGVAAIFLCAPVLLFGLPTSLLIAALFLGYLLVNALVEGRWERLRQQIEKEIPTLLIRLSSLLKANPNLIETLDSVADGLDPDRPLKPWVKRLASRLQSSGRRGLEEMQLEAQSISPSLLLAVVEIGRLWETGGKGYSDALRMASENVADLVQTRAQANAVASGAWGTTRTILLALGFTLGAVLVNPVSKPAFQTPLLQLGLLLLVVWGGFGYWQIRDAIASVTE